MKYTDEKLDILIEKSQKDYRDLYIKIKRVELKLQSLFERRYPSGRFHASFYNKPYITVSPVASLSIKPDTSDTGKRTK